MAGAEFGSWARYLNPRYHAKKIVEDVRGCIKAIQNREAFGVGMTHQELAHALRGHLFGSFFLSGWVSWVGFLTGAAVQAKTQNPFIGLIVTIVVGHIAATVAFQIVWWADHRAFYRAGGKPIWASLYDLERDLIPIHLAGFRLALTFGLITVPLNAAWLFALNNFAPAVARELPAGIWVAIIDVVLVHSTFVRVMGDLFEGHSHVLADRFAPRLNLSPA